MKKPKENRKDAKNTQEPGVFLVRGVSEKPGGWDIAIHINGMPGYLWISVSEEDFPVPPEVDDFATVILPKVILITSP